MLASNGPGLTLEGTVLQGYTQCAVKVMNCDGTSDRPVTLMGLTALTVKETDAAILFDLNPKVKSPALNQHIVVKYCTFQGPARSPVQATQSGITEDVSSVPPPVVIARPPVSSVPPK